MSVQLKKNNVFTKVDNFYFSYVYFYLFAIYDYLSSRLFLFYPFRYHKNSFQHETTGRFFSSTFLIFVKCTPFDKFIFTRKTIFFLNPKKLIFIKKDNFFDQQKFCVFHQKENLFLSEKNLFSPEEFYFFFISEKKTHTNYQKNHEYGVKFQRKVSAVVEGKARYLVADMQNMYYRAFGGYIRHSFS